MIFPRYSIRWLLALVIAAALFFLCFSLAMRGHHWAAGVVAPGLGLLLLFALFLIAYSVLYAMGTVVEGVIGPSRVTTTPFASQAPAKMAHLPADILPPEPLAVEIVTPEVVEPAAEQASSDAPDDAAANHRKTTDGGGAG